jgi:hypothetical protein
MLQRRKGFMTHRSAPTPQVKPAHDLIEAFDTCGVDGHQSLSQLMGTADRLRERQELLEPTVAEFGLLGRCKARCPAPS